MNISSLYQFFYGALLRMDRVWQIDGETLLPIIYVYIKKQRYPFNGPWRPIRLWDVEAPTFSRQSAHRWRRVCQPYAPAGHLIPQGRFLVLISVRGCVDPRAIVRLEKLGQLKNPMTSPGIEPTFNQSNIRPECKKNLVLSGYKSVYRRAQLNEWVSWCSITWNIDLYYKLHTTYCKKGHHMNAL
jgi:hypothetical protein